MKDFSFFIPTHFEFGHGAEERAGELCAALGATRVLMVYGRTFAVKSGLVERVRASLKRARIHTLELGGVKPNPTDTLVYKGIRRCRDAHVDFVLAVGGGSVIDTAKAIAAGVPYEGDFWDFMTGDATPASALKVGVVLTIAASGSESSNSCVITQDKTNKKRSLNHECIRPVLSIMNPDLTCSVPPFFTACGATDIMAHVFERYFTNEPNNDTTDRLCEALLSSVVRAMPMVLYEPHNYDARAELMWAGTLAHNNTVGVGRVSDGASHKIAHEMGGIYDIVHGAALAIIFPAWMRYQLEHHDPTRLVQLAVRVWGCDMDFSNPKRTALNGIDRFEQFLRDIGMPVRLHEVGLSHSDIFIISQSVKRDSEGLVGNFTRLDTFAIEEILRIAER